MFISLIPNFAQMKSLLSTLFLLLFSSWMIAQSPCLSSSNFNIVVLGSSTAAGAGPSSPDSTWVNRFTAYVQDINPANQVFNLAVGGYNTYRIMPTGFVPPASRPNPDVNANITEAINLGADAIIVNMPSNDVASNYTTQEQLFNLDTIVQIADANNIPIWICTTQPRNFSDPLKLQQQWDIKDSIYLYFNPYAIDFWTSFALPDHSLDPYYDSGDGVHMNDPAHALMFDRVVQASILDSIFTPSSGVDYFVYSNQLISDSLCGEANAVLETIVVNIGAAGTSDFNLIQELEHENLGVLADSSHVIAGLATCETDTITMVVNTSFEGAFDFCSYTLSSLDTIPSNDSLCINFLRLGIPTIQVLNDTLCDPGMALLEVVVDPVDTVFWYTSPSATTPIASGNTYLSNFISSTNIWYAEAIRGDLFYKDQLSTTLNSNINFNGAMFNMVANQETIIDSLGIKINSLGSQGVEVFVKSGSYEGSELIPGNWTLLSSSTVNVSNSSDLTYVSIPNFTLLTNDTVGVHVRMSNSGSNLSYTNSGSPQIYQDTVLSLIAGSGIAYGFSNSYYPRIWNGSVHYHFGNKADGDCKTDRVAVSALVNDLTFDIGPDTIIDIAQTITLSAPTNMNGYLWSTGDTTASITFTGSDLGTGIHHLTVAFYDSLNCLKKDTVIVAVADLVGLNKNNEIAIKIYPNPVMNEIYLNIENNLPITRVSLFSSQGLLIKEFNLDENQHTIDVSYLSAGSYFVRVSHEFGQSTKSFNKL